jgi:hypothetical protein
VEPTNVVAAYVIMAVVLSLFSPIADPARIAVADQIRRPETGRVTPEQFDYRFLRFWSGRYGTAALERLAAQTEGPQAAAISARAKQAKNALNPWQTEVLSATAQSRGANISVVHPRGEALPNSFLRFDWTKEATVGTWPLPRCLVVTDARCEAVLLDLDGDGGAEVLLFALPDSRGATTTAVFKAAAGETWTWLGSIANVQCSGAREALMSGQVRQVEAKFKDIEAGGVRLRIAERPCVR